MSAENTQLIHHPMTSDITPVGLQALSAWWNLDEETQVNQLRNLYPGAADDSIKLVLSYCKALNLDPLLKPYHIVPMKVKTGEGVKRDGSKKATYGMRDVVLPGIGLYRIQAARTGLYAGMDEPEFGPEREFQFKRTEWSGDSNNRTSRKIDSSVMHPEWCRITIYKVTAGVRCAFTVREYWLECVAMSDGAPNAMWQKRGYGMLAKCAEAQALRKAFPEVGQMPTYEEMLGRRALDPEDEEISIDGEDAPRRVEPQRKSLTHQPIEGVPTQAPEQGPKLKVYGRDDVPPPDAPKKSAPPPAQTAGTSTAKASAGEIAHLRGFYKDRLDEACERAELSVRASNFDELTKDGFIALRDLKKEWR